MKRESVPVEKSLFELMCLEVAVCGSPQNSVSAPPNLSGTFPELLTENEKDPLDMLLL